MGRWVWGRWGAVELRGVVWFGVMEPLWAGWGCGVVGMAGCGVMELWGVLP